MFQGEFRRPKILRLSQPVVPLREIADIIVDKMVLHLKGKFLKRNTSKFLLDDVLSEMGETGLHEDLKRTLVDEALPVNPRIQFSEGRVSFIPPLQMTLSTDMVALIREKSKRNEGVLEDDILDSSPVGDTIIWNLQKDPSITVVQRADDKKVLFSLNHPKNGIPVVDDELKTLFHSINTRNLHPIDIEVYLKNHKLKPLEALQKFVPQLAKKSKAKKSKKPKKNRIRDNKHVANLTSDFEDDEGDISR